MKTETSSKTTRLRTRLRMWVLVLFTVRKLLLLISHTVQYNNYLWTFIFQQTIIGVTFIIDLL